MVLKLIVAFPRSRSVLVISVPLRGYGFEIKDKVEGYGAVTNNFRPLAGIWFWNNGKIHLDKGFNRRFPSPCGDMVLKYQQSEGLRYWYSLYFRPLAGIWFWNLIKKHSNLLQRCNFRPLAGIWFWNNGNWRKSIQENAISVPLRGYGFEIRHHWNLIYP